MKAEMTHRERFYEVVTHGKPDRAVYDLSGSPQTNVDYDVPAENVIAIFRGADEYYGGWN